MKAISRRRVLLGVCGVLTTGGWYRHRDQHDQPVDATTEPDPFGDITVSAFDISASSVVQPLTVQITFHSPFDTEWPLDGRVDYHKAVAAEPDPIKATSPLPESLPPGTSTVTFTEYTPRVPGTYHVVLRGAEQVFQVANHQRVSVGKEK